MKVPTKWLKAAAAVIFAAALVFAAVGYGGGTILIKTAGDPQQTAVQFLDAVSAGDYPAAYETLLDYTTLGLENEPDSEAGKLIGEALRKSYRYELSGAAERNGLHAVQNVRFTFLHLPSMESAVAHETQTQLKKLARSLSYAELYNESGVYRPAVTEKAYLLALQSILASAGEYCATETVPLSLSYSDGRWQIVADETLLRVLNGGAES